MTYSRELNDRSPLRVLEQSIHGGLGRGNLGVVCAGHGAGKSAFLVGIALDVLMRGNQVLHVALDQPADRVRNYYDEIFAELAREEHLEDAARVRHDVDRNRHIHTYQERSFRVADLDRSLSFLRQQHTRMEPQLILVDGYEWEKGSTAEIAELKRFASENQAELWMSAGIDRDKPVTHPKGFPEPIARYESLVDVLLRLKGANGTAHLSILKDHENPNPGAVALDLDSTTLLLVRR
jgi:hypothetical protein